MREMIDANDMAAWEEWHKMVRHPYVTGWICAEWRKSFVKFLRDMGRPLPREHLVRREVKEKFCKENCYWG